MEYSKNNNAIMKTVVETFVIEETESLIYDNEKLDRWNEIVGNLELAGQQKIVKPEKSPIPFLFMNQNMVQVFRTLCPRHVDVSDFDASPIPLEILDLIALSKKENYFDKIEVWYDDKTPDPAVIGIKGYWFQGWGSGNDALAGKEFSTEDEARQAGATRPYFNDRAKYLIGKWGDVKQSLEELKERAKRRFISEESVQLKRTIKDAQRRLDDLEATSLETFGA